MKIEIFFNKGYTPELLTGVLEVLLSVLKVLGISVEMSAVVPDTEKGEKNG